jgi:hypothetical protein
MHPNFCLRSILHDLSVRRVCNWRYLTQFLMFTALFLSLRYSILKFNFGVSVGQLLISLDAITVNRIAAPSFFFNIAGIRDQM